MPREPSPTRSCRAPDGRCRRAPRWRRVLDVLRMKLRRPICAFQARDVAEQHRTEPEAPPRHQFHNNSNMTP
uniref:Uncharacterized protein n=1 Tax=Oryza glumipatula TaxID=40148 RepID=A0A0D9YE22_9ORYZ